MSLTPIFSRDANEQAPAVPAAHTRPRFRDVAKDWAALSDRLAELTRREEEILAELKPLNESMARNGLFETVLPQRRPVAVTPERAPRVEALLGDLVPPPAPTATVVSLPHGRWRELREELDAVRTAITLVHEPLNRAWFSGSATYCLAVAPDYRKIAETVCNAMIALGHALAAHEAFADDLRAQGVAWAMLRALPVQPFGNPAKPDSEISRFLKDAVESAYIHPDDVPAEWLGAGAARRGKGKKS